MMCFILNMSYQIWLRSCLLNTLEEEDSILLPDELEVQSLWYQGVFGSDFTTIDGEPVRISYLGEWNKSAGPDFLECLLSVNGVEKKGALEIDLSPLDWEQHGHAVNPAFNEVILHVSVHENKVQSYCRNALNQEIPQVSLPVELVNEHFKKRLSVPKETIPGFCAEEFSKWSFQEVDELLRSAARHRLQKKARKLAHQISAIGITETLWQGLATTLGYHPNQQEMRLLAQRLKAKTLHQFPSLESRLSVLLGTADFLSPEIVEGAPVETRSYLKQLWDHWWKHRESFELSGHRKIEWKMAGLRPVNHPHRRVATLAHLLPKLQEVAKSCEAPSAEGFKALGKTLTSIQDSFWSSHYTLTSKESKRSLTLFGAEKYKELLCNFLIPIWYLEDKERAFHYFTTLRSSSKNNQVVKALGRLFATSSELPLLSKWTYQHQGLQQLYHDFCLHSGCLTCPFPKYTDTTPATPRRPLISYD